MYNLYCDGRYAVRGSKSNSNINVTSLLLNREFNGAPHSSRYIQKRLQSSQVFVDRLEQEAVLTGHDGCVNCLEWSNDGRILASASDDLHVIIWDPFRQKALHKIKTRHQNNIFSIKFLPRHNDSLIATGAGDKCILVYDINRTSDAILSCQCHSLRVKRLATAPDSPYVFWSAGEDGTILQLDIREKHVCCSGLNRTRLINLATYLDRTAEAKCLAINPRRTEMLAVGASDPYARIYDRRMLQTTSSNSGAAMHVLINDINIDTPENIISNDAVTYYCPGHVNKNSKVIEHEPRTITYLTFNAAGTELLVNMSTEHVYLYDLQGCEQPVFLNLPEYKKHATCSSGDVEMTSIETMSPTGDAGDVSMATATTSCASTAAAASLSSSSNKRKLPEHIEAYKKMGNDFLENEKYLAAINAYSDAIAMAPHCPVLYLNRATAYMRRLWFGDVYAALRDCHEALRLDPSYIKAHFRLARALLELGRAKEADECLKELINRFPSYASNHGVMMLNKDIKENKQSFKVQQQASEYHALEVSDSEFLWRSKAKDYTQRFVGHCNTTTDIKEANFFGPDGDYIVAGSDDGNFFMWERKTGKIQSVYRADGAIVNCVQPHPTLCLMATSGIDNDVKIWSPIAETSKRPHLISYINNTVEENQLKMKADPFDLNTRNAFCLNG